MASPRTPDLAPETTVKRRRIDTVAFVVARVEELLRWCDALEGQLHQTRTRGAHPLNSTLHHLLAA
jgi:hypothetical protein